MLRLVGSLEPARAHVLVVDQIASALDAAHARGLVHRDVQAGEHPRHEGDREGALLPLRLRPHAEAPDPTGSQSEPAHLSGTVAYTSPEQITGDARDRAGGRLFARVRPLRVPVRRAAVCRSEVRWPSSSPTSRSLHHGCRPTRRWARFSRGLSPRIASERYATAGEFVEEAVAALGGKELPPELDFRTLARRQGGRPSLAARSMGTSDDTGTGQVAVISGPRGMGKTRLAAELAREVRAEGGEVRYVSCVGGGDSAATSAGRGRRGDDARAARHRRPRRGGRRSSSTPCASAGHAVASTSALVLATSRTAFPGAPHRELKPLDTAALAELAGSIAGDAAVALPLDAVLEGDRRCSPARSRDRRRMAAGRGESPSRASSAARRRRPSGAARRPGRPHQQRRRSPAGSRPSRGGHRCRRAGVSVQGPGELRRRRCRRVLRAGATGRRARRAPTRGDAARCRRAVGKREVVHRACRALCGTRQRRASRIGGVDAGRHPPRRPSARRARTRKARTRQGEAPDRRSTSSRRYSRSVATTPNGRSSSTLSPARRRTRRLSSPSGPTSTAASRLSPAWPPSSRRTTSSSAP